MDDYWAKKDAAKKEAEAAPEVEEPADADAEEPAKEDK